MYLLEPLHDYTGELLDEFLVEYVIALNLKAAANCCS
jgi:hypothetical protein